MKPDETKRSSRGGYALVSALVIACLAQAARADGDCAGVESDAERLHCYDRVHRRLGAPTLSLWEDRILKDAERETFTLTAYRPSYLTYTQLRTVNREPYRFIDPAGRVSERELKVHLSLQTKAYDNLFGYNGDLWLAYTQVAYWQAFNADISSPFREINHEPEAFVSFLTDYPLLGWTARTIDVGAVHQSNGQAMPLSRSWNRLYARFQFVRGDVSLTFKPWLRLKEHAANDDNPRIQDYLGRYELRLSHERRKQVYSLQLRNVFDRERRYNAELSWSFPIHGRLRGLVQWYHGYGESLIDHDFRNNRVGIGFLMSDWL